MVKPFFRVNYLILIFGLFLICIDAKESKKYANHVIILGIDGLAANYVVDATSRGLLPNLKMLREQGAFSMNNRNMFPTSSASNWMSVLNGATPEMHGVDCNNWLQSSHRIPDINGDCTPTPNMFSVMKQQNKSTTVAVIAGWGFIVQELTFPAHEMDRQVGGFGDPESGLHHALKSWKEMKPTILFVHFNFLDNMGHDFGYGSQFDAGATRIDAAIGKLVQAVDSSPEGPMTTFFVVSDHGRTLSGLRHGDFALSQLNTMFIARGAGVRVKNHTLKTPVTIIDTAPTVLFALGYQFPLQYRGIALEEIFEKKFGWLFEASEKPNDSCKNVHRVLAHAYQPDSWATGMWNGAVLVVLLVLNALVFIGCLVFLKNAFWRYQIYFYGDSTNRRSYSQAPLDESFEMDALTDGTYDEHGNSIRPAETDHDDKYFKAANRTVKTLLLDNPFFFGFLFLFYLFALCSFLFLRFYIHFFIDQVQQVQDFDQIYYAWDYENTIRSLKQAGYL